MCAFCDDFIFYSYKPQLIITQGLHSLVPFSSFHEEVAHRKLKRKPGCMRVTKATKKICLIAEQLILIT